MTRNDILKMLDANPDGFLARLFFSAVNGAAAIPECHARATIDYALDCCVEFSNADAEMRGEKK